MYIQRLSIRNFRTFRNVAVQFKNGVNTIIGENGSGKTNLFYALRLLIDETLPRGIKFSETDFNRSLTDWKGHWIIVQILFADLDAGEEAQAISMHEVGNPTASKTDIGSYSLYYRPRERFRKKIYEYSIQGDKSQEGLNEVLASITLNDYEAIYMGKGAVDFSEDKIYEKYVGNFDQIIFPNPDDERADIYGVKLFGSIIPSEVSCTFAKALRDVEADLRSYKDNPLLNLLRGQDQEIPEDKKNGIEDKVRKLNDELSNLDEIKKISGGISETIKRSVGETYAPGIKIQSELPDELERLMQSLKLLVGDPDEPDYQGKIWELSLGGANLIYISLKLLEYEKIKSQNRIANFILIEEPEAHIHTHIQKSLFQKLSGNNTQVIISTHSTHISSVSKISSMSVLARAKKQAIVFNPSKNLETGDITRIERYLDAVRTNLLFAKGILLVEGDAEQIVIPALIRKNFGASLDELGLSIVNIGSTGFENIAKLFHKDRIRKHCAILTDLDQSIVSLPDDANEDSDYEKDCRNSAISGEQRKKILNEFCADNVFVEPFYADYTFEVDFILKGNDHEIYQAIESEYAQKNKLASIKNNLSSSDVAISGKEVLRLANKFGKGWFAIMLAERINHLTGIPDYILDAIVFSAPHLSNRVLYNMALFRLQEFKRSTYEGDTTNYDKLLGEFLGFVDENEALSFYQAQLKKDSLVTLINKLNFI